MNKVKRALALYELLMSAPSLWWSQKEICRRIDAYRYIDRDNDRCPAIREDMLYLNSLTNIEKIVVCSNYEFKVASKNEVESYYRKRIKRLKSQVKQLKDLELKMRRDQHGDIIDNKWWETYWKYEEE